MITAFDTETFLIDVGQQAPRLVCMSYCDEGCTPQLVKPNEAVSLVTGWLKDPDRFLVGHNTAFDTAVLVAAGVDIELFFAAYEAGRIFDTGINEKLLDIAKGEFFNAKGRYSLDRLSTTRLGRKLDKSADSWRLRYSELIDVPLETWPEDAKTYSLLDALSTLQVWQSQGGPAPNLAEQCRYDFWLRLMSVWGIKTDPQKAYLLEQETLKERNRIRRMLEENGLVRANGVRDTKAAQERMLAVMGEPRLTPTGKPCLDSDSCTLSGDPLLEAYSDYTTLTKVLSTDVPILQQSLVHTGYGLAGTGRTTSCIAKGAFVQTPCHRGDYPQGKPIEEIRAGDLVYSYDLSGNLYLQKVLWAGMTGHKPVVKVSWRGQGRKHSGELLLTKEHRVMLFEGVWREAGELRPGDRITALSCRPKGCGEARYQYLYARGSESFREHVFVNESITGQKQDAVHHKDHDKDNNNPDNLQGMSATNHHRLHAEQQSPETLDKKIAALLNPETRRRQLAALKTGSDHALWEEVSKTTLLRWAAKCAGKVTSMSRLTGHDHSFIQSKCDSHGINLMSLRKRYNLDGKYLSKRVVRLAMGLRGNDRHKSLHVSYYRFPELVDFWGLSNNHEVLSVEPSGTCDVYDLEVEHTSSFIANELCVHNSKPNVQNIRRMPGIRESFVPRPGYVFIDADYNALELYSLAQACLDMFGASELAEVLKSGKDPHTALAGDLLGISYEEAAKRKKDKKDKEFDNARQTGKVGNFGLPGGLGADKLVLFARKTYDVVLTREKAVELKKQWFARWPEMRPYFEYWTRETATADGRGTVVLPRSNRVRGGLRFTECCNTRFQGPASDAAKEAGWLIAKACYIEEDSVLFGSRPVAFIHDQWLIETPDNDKAHNAAQETVRLMKLGASRYLPDMVPPVEPLLCRYWSKEAAPVLKEDGRLGVWP